MPEYPPTAVRYVTELVVGISQPSLLEEISKVEKLGEFTQRTYGSPETATKTETTAHVQQTYGSPETIERAETQAMVQKTFGSPETPPRSEKITFKQP
jgi:hypothetical protein